MLRGVAAPWLWRRTRGRRLWRFVAQAVPAQADGAGGRVPQLSRRAGATAAPLAGSAHTYIAHASIHSIHSIFKHIVYMVYIVCCVCWRLAGSCRPFQRAMRPDRTGSRRIGSRVGSDRASDLAGSDRTASDRIESRRIRSRRIRSRRIGSNLIASHLSAVGGRNGPGGPAVPDPECGAELWLQGAEYVGETVQRPAGVPKPIHKLPKCLHV